MAFYYESIDMDLKKNFVNFQYDQLEDENAQSLAYNVNELQQSLDQQGQQLVEEKEVILKDIRNLCSYFYQKCCGDLSKQEKKLSDFPFEKIKNRLCHIIEKYQEQSSLLDNLLESLVTPLASVIKVYLHKETLSYLKNMEEGEQLDPKQQFFLYFLSKSVHLILAPEFHTIADTLYIIGKVRGVRHICRYFPHEVRDLEPVVLMLQKSSIEDLNAHWESKYVLLLWLSVIVLVPFDLQTIDSNLFSGINQEIFVPELKGSIILCLLNLGISYLRSSTKLRNAGALFLSKLFSRPDVLKTTLLNEFVVWSVRTVKKLQDDVVNGFFVTGVLETLVEILKNGQRNEVKPILEQLILLITERKKGNAVISLFITKLSQRVGLIYLRPRVVNWAYKKGNQNLASTLTIKIDHSKLVTNAKVNAIINGTSTSTEQLLQLETTDYFADVDQGALEAVIDNLLIGLTNKDTIVRWSAAKGIGRICGRLELDQADDVFTCLLDTCFTPIQGDTAWHGGCLALGELCRRGLILAGRLKQVIPIVCKALVFEQNQGGYSVGVNVRDSACYVAWSAARAYDPEILLPYLPILSQTLAVVMLYDREVNVRRAASSTFQELVGRCPNVIPHGISILAESDYFALALRHNAYLKVAPFVASFIEYFPQIVDHLAFVKVQSQDKEVRKLASKALSRLVPINVNYFIDNQVMLGLIDQVQSPSINAKHGALYALGDLLVSISGRTDESWEEKELKDSVFLRTLTKNEKKLAKAGEHISKFQEQYETMLHVNNINLVPQELLSRILEIPKYIEESKLLRGKVGELLRVAVCRLIQCISISKLDVNEKQHQFYLDLIEDCLKNPLEDSQDGAVKALSILSQSYHLKYQVDGLKFLDRVLKELQSANKLIAKSGYAQSIGSFAPNLLQQRLKEIVSIFSKMGISKRSTSHSLISTDPDSRKFAVRSLGQAVSKVLASGLEIEDCVLQQSVKVLLHSLQDYTMNKRGDVGLYIRENAIVSLQMILGEYVKTKKNAIDASLIEEIVGSLLQQLMEKIDRVRLVAGSVLQDIFQHIVPELPKFQNVEILSKVFSTKNLQEALTSDQGRVDQSFQSDVIEAEVKQLKQVLAHMRQTELIYHWNLPHCCYRLIVPLLALENFTFPLLKGLCVSVGGISESIQIYSEQALLQHALINVEQHLPLIFDAAIKLMQIHVKDERILNPLYKMIGMLLEKEEVHNFTQIKPYVKQIFELVRQETKNSEAIKKVSESVPIIIESLSLNPEEIGKECVKAIIEYLASDLPKVRKQTADKFYLFLMAFDDEELITMDSNMQLQEYLLEKEWLAEVFDRQLTQSQLESFFKQ